MLAAAEIPDTLPGRREADRRVRQALGMNEADCPDVWKAVKALDRATWSRLLEPVVAP